MAKIMLAVKAATYHNLPIEEQEALIRHADKVERIEPGVVAIVIDAEIVERLNIDWDALQMGGVRKIVSDIKRRAH